MKLTSYRESRGLTIREAADVFGVVHETWRRYESGERTPSVEMIALIEEWSDGRVTGADFIDAAALDGLRQRMKAAPARPEGRAA
jgi:transcriptional regulator with XRE-family HTH domain